MKLRNCRVCGKKGIKFASNGCKFCGAAWVSDISWNIAKKKSLKNGKVLRNISEFERIIRSIMEGFFPFIKFVGAAAVFLSIVYFALSGSDPFIHGCVYDKDYGEEISCVEIKYNEAKDPGSEEEAFNSCMRQLNREGKASGNSYEIIGCISSLGPYN